MVWPFDAEIDALNALYTWLEGIYNSIITLPWTITTFVFAVMMALVYPIIAIFDILLTFIYDGYQTLALFINALISIPNMIFYTFDTMLSTNFPAFLVLVFVILITIRIMQIIYKHTKGISIAGFKIG